MFAKLPRRKVRKKPFLQFLSFLIFVAGVASVSHKRFSGQIKTLRVFKGAKKDIE